MPLLHLPAQITVGRKRGAGCCSFGPQTSNSARELPQGAPWSWWRASPRRPAPGATRAPSPAQNLDLSAPAAGTSPVIGQLAPPVRAAPAVEGQVLGGR